MSFKDNVCTGFTFPRPPRWKRLLWRIPLLGWFFRPKFRFKKVNFPVVKRVWPVLKAEDLVSVQPMVRRIDDNEHL
jgi:hypothetical protein